jgi:dimethylhistidine N-methyltransferase
LPSKYLYDARGSLLFEEICRLEEYYLTRIEAHILRTNLSELSRSLGSGVRLIEPGAGSGIKTEMLLRELDDPVAYVPVDVSEKALSDAVARLSPALPHLDILPVHADFMEPVELPDGRRAEKRTAVFFPGSTIGNLLPDEVLRFLRRMAQVMGPDGALVVGVDLRKDRHVLERAYNDAKGVTAEFNLNLLERLDRELEATFRRTAFRHLAFFNDVHGRIEMHLVSDSAQRVRVAGWTFDFEPGESILTEYSYKYSPEGFRGMCRDAGLEILRSWTDLRGWFGIYLCVPGPGGNKEAK